MKRIRFVSCQVERTVEWTTKHYLTGEVTGRETKTHACRIPLFSEVEMHSGVCDSCAVRWEAPGSIITAAGRAYIESSERR